VSCEQQTSQKTALFNVTFMMFTVTTGTVPEGYY
jgi:hypothetical protein